MTSLPAPASRKRPRPHCWTRCCCRCCRSVSTLGWQAHLYHKLLNVVVPHNFHHQNQYFVAKAHWYLYPTVVTCPELETVFVSLPIWVFFVLLSTPGGIGGIDAFVFVESSILPPTWSVGDMIKIARSFLHKNFLHAWSSGVHSLHCHQIGSTKPHEWKSQWHCDSHSCGFVEPIWWFIPSL